MTARTALAAVAGLVVAVAVAVAAVWIWLGTYAPLRALGSGFAPGPKVGAEVEPVPGSGGRPVFFPVLDKSRTFDAAFTLHNTGRFAVTVEGLERDAPKTPPWIGADELLATTSSTASASSSRLLPFQTLRIDPGDTAIVVVRFALRCAGATARSPDVYTDGVRLRYSYLSLFTRKATIRLPFAVTLRCVGGPPASP
jgi:hypothetical protein